MNKKPAQEYDAILDNIELHYMGAWTFVVKGKIWDDKKKRFNNGEFVTTSRVKSIDFENGLIFTKNSVYLIEV